MRTSLLFFLSTFLLPSFAGLDHGFYNEQGERLTSEIIRDIQQWYTLFVK
ncbi:hypothetical protein [Proteus sp. G2669]|nr:hypothetical protein [Proteus sp. G2669]